MSFSRGQQLVWRSRPLGTIGYVFPFTLLEDSADAIAVLQHDGSMSMKRTGRRGGPNGRSMPPGGWDGGHAAVRWNGFSLRVHPPGTNHSVIRRWDQSLGRPEGWYVNLELDWRRTPIGFDTLDLVLGVVANDDLSDPRLKDEDELQWSEEEGQISHEHAALARGEAARVLAAIGAREGLFACDWTRWRPEESWPVPLLPENWRSA